jgi:hypothetical protein
MYALAGDSASDLCSVSRQPSQKMTRSMDLPGSDRSGGARRADDETAPNGLSVALAWVVVKPYPPKVFG